MVTLAPSEVSLLLLAPILFLNVTDIQGFKFGDLESLNELVMEVSKLEESRLEAFEMEVSKQEVVTRLVVEGSTMLLGNRLLLIGFRLDVISRLQEGFMRPVSTKSLVDTMVLRGGQEKEVMVFRKVVELRGLSVATGQLGDRFMVGEVLLGIS